MSNATIDLAGRSFWLFAFAAILWLAVATGTRLRDAGFAMINLGMLFWLVADWVAAAMIYAFVLWGTVWISRHIIRVPITLVTLLALGVNFALFKFPLGDSAEEWHPWAPVMAAIGFSYVFLRSWDFLVTATQPDEPLVSPVRFINYLFPFHMLAAGPIQSYDDFVVDQQDAPSPLTASDVLEGIERIAWGLFKKFVLAFMIRELFLTDFQSTGVVWFLEVQAFFLWLYIDFSAYSDIAVGLGRLMRVDTPENFNRPYLARDMVEFWNRWHISLSMWVKRNLFIPLQLWMTRRSTTPRPLLTSSIALAVAFLFVGLWHEISIAYLLWGTWHAAGVVLSNAINLQAASRLGSKRYQELRARPSVTWILRFITFQYVAFSMLCLFVTS